MKIDIKDMKTISIAEDEHLFINIGDKNISMSDVRSFRRHLADIFGHNRIIVVNCNDIEMTKIKYLDTVKKASVWRT